MFSKDRIDMELYQLNYNVKHHEKLWEKQTEIKTLLQSKIYSVSSLMRKLISACTFLVTANVEKEKLNSRLVTDPFADRRNLRVYSGKIWSCAADSPGNDADQCIVDEHRTTAVA